MLHLCKTNFKVKKLKFTIMKDLKRISLKMLVKFSFVILLLFNACAPSGGSNNTPPEKNVETKSVTETPKIDL